jgi:phosphate transport system substrate-binding protein
MYQGGITSWNDPRIAAINPGVTLPHTRVVSLHRADSSGDTFLFTSYLSTQDAAWDRVTGYGTTVGWAPVPGARAETGNTGMVAGCEATPGCVAYIGIGYQVLNLISPSCAPPARPREAPRGRPPARGTMR